MEWTSWAPVPNKPTVSVDVKQHSASQNVEQSRHAFAGGTVSTWGR